MATDSFVQCRVSSETKARLRAFASEQQLSESAVIQRLLDQTLFRPSELVASTSGRCDAPRSERLYVRLSRADRLLLQARADGRGMAEATYVSLLLCAHLRNSAPLPKTELAAFLRCIAELSAFRGSLFRAGALTPHGTTENVRLMIRICEGLRDHIKALLSANAASWAPGDKDG